MENLLPEIPAEVAGVLNLGVALGESHAFGVVSGRTLAARAACLQRVRDEKLYLALEPTWEAFCPKYLGMSRAEADRTIRLWQEFGAGYFELSALTRVSAETYRAIAPSVRDGVLYLDGEVIELNAVNSRRASTAVARFRQTQPRKTAPPETGDPVEDLRRRILVLIREFQGIARQERDGENWLMITVVAEQLSAEIARIVADDI